MLGGLAAGLGFGVVGKLPRFGWGFGQILMFGLLALGVMMAIGWFRRSRQRHRKPKRLEMRRLLRFKGLHLLQRQQHLP